MDSVKAISGESSSSRKIISFHVMKTRVWNIGRDRIHVTRGLGVFASFVLNELRTLYVEMSWNLYVTWILSRHGFCQRHFRRKQ